MGSGWQGQVYPSRLKRADPALSVRFSRSFEDLFTRGEVRTVIDLAEELLGRHGGLLFEGYRLDAPSEWRRAVPPNSPDKAVWFSLERQEAMDK